MLQRMKKKTLRRSLQLFCLLAATLLVWGCGGGGSSSYDTPQAADNAPVADAASNALIDATTLKGWIDQGLVGNETGFDTKVVVLDYGPYDDVSILTDRIPGSCRVAKGDLIATRFEGVGDAAPLVGTGAQMDAVIQRLGIDEDTVIVFTTNTKIYYATRAYWTFRYWGFPKENLRLLNGGNDGFAAAYPELMTTDVPVPTPSTFSVRNLAGVNTDLRASVGEMIVIASDLASSTENLVFDARGKDPLDGGSGYYGTGVTPGLVGGDVVVVDGHPEGGQYLNYSALVSDDYKSFDAVADIAAQFAAKDANYADKKVTVYCTSGYSATPLFFALDALLGVDAQLYDGSWSQLGKYSDFAAAGGQLPLGSDWAIDQYLNVDTYNYNDDIPASPALVIETLDADSAVAPQAAPFTGDDPSSDSDVVQSQVEAADIAYADGSGATSFAAPVATATPSVLIDYDTLKGWSDDGLVNKASGEKVVIFDVTSDSAYAAGHIPGAVFWPYAGQAIVRTEGPAPAVNMVLDGASMDARLQAAGVDANTTVVITSSATATYFPSRAYFLFRYWGFPKERIKVLNGYNAAWPTPDLTSAVPAVSASSFSVADLDSGAQLDTRVALAELMDAARDGRGTAIDFRGDKAATKSTAGVYGDVAGDYVVFEGRINGGKYFSWQMFNEDYANGDLRYKSAGEIEAAMLDYDINVDAFSNDGSYSNPVYSYCRTGYIASTGFFVLDAILNIDVMVYDGSWSQWGKMSDDASKGGELASAAWSTDTSDYMSIINYNADHTKVVEPLNPDADALQLAPADANQVEEADIDYQELAPVDDGGSEAPAEDGGSSPPVGC